MTDTDTDTDDLRLRYFSRMAECMIAVSKIAYADVALTRADHEVRTRARGQR
jgi:hypothetical protein